MSAREYPSVEYLRQCFRYEDGKLFWLDRPKSHFLNDANWVSWNKQNAGKQAGCRLKTRQSHRWVISLGSQPSKLYRATVVWALHTGDIVKFLDHKNRLSFDDRIDNLRLATGSQNGANKDRMSNNRSGYKGIYQHSETKRWCATIKVNGQRMHLGTFGSPVEAHAAYCEAARKYCGEFACEGSIP